MIKRYRKKPVVIEAMQFLGTNYIECLDFMNISGARKKKIVESFKEYEPNTEGALYINTREGTMKCSLNDWIVKGIHGEFYPCKPDIFSETYIEENDETTSD